MTVAHHSLLAARGGLGAEAAWKDALAAAREAKAVLAHAEAQAAAAVGFAHLQPYGEVDHEAIALLEEALDELPPADGAVRAQLLARLALRTDPVT
jgi:hypothetical protein